MRKKIEARAADESVASYEYVIAPERIAHAPAQPRDSARLLYLREDGRLEHYRFFDLPKLLTAGDVLVINETRVIKAKLRGERCAGGSFEALVLGLDSSALNRLRVLAKPARRLKPGTRVRIGDTFGVFLAPDVLQIESDAGFQCATFLETHGEVPLPPYIAPPSDLDLDQAYQTIFARVPGSIAAPTASLHFTDTVFQALRERGVQVVPLVLAVGLGTFAPVRTALLTEHAMHEEVYDIPQSTVAAISAARARGSRVIAVGTTVVRALESAVDTVGQLQAGAGRTRLFIRPGYDIRIVDALLTNFHVPRSTLMALVAAFCGRERLLQAYEEALALEYRFFSFGDAMLIA